MIQLDVMGCCENCGRFEPVLKSDMITTMNGNVIRHRISCELKEMCVNMLDYLRKEANKNG